MTADRLYTLNTGHWTFDFSMAVQMTNVGEPYAGTCPVYLVEHPEGTVLFDTGLSYEMKENPTAYGPDGAPHMAEFVDGQYLQWGNLFRVAPFYILIVILMIRPYGLFGTEDIERV